MKTKSVFLAFAALVLLSGCKSHYQLSNVSRTRILVDKRFDQQPDAVAAAYLIPYTQHVDSLMNPLVGRTAEYLDRGIPEGLLSNLLPDIFMWASSRYNEKPDFAMYNYGGIRAALPAGDITRLVFSRILLAFSNVDLLIIGSCAFSKIAQVSGSVSKRFFCL
jgi:hypothetical protein